MKNDSNQSQLRKFTKFTIRNRINAFIQSFRVGKLGDNVFLDKNIRLERFPKNIFIDDNVVIKEGARICPCNQSSTITIGKNTTIGFYTFIYSSASINIGNDCLIAPFVYIVDSDHSISKDELINRQPNQTARIIIEDDVWIGTGAKILKGITIGKGAVIAAGSVVKNDVPPYKIYGGIPAKEISERQ